MEITDVRIKKITGAGKLLAIATITIDDSFAVHDVKIIGGDNGLFIAMPSVKTADGTYRDIAHPINSAVRSAIQESVLRKYKEVESE